MADEVFDCMLKLDEVDCADPVLDWEEVFGNSNPVEIELGIGKGRFILDAARRRPETNFCGVEWAGKYLGLAQKRCVRQQLKNLRLIKTDAREFIEFFVPSVSLQALHIYFPDPWPKKRHHKRRLFKPDFLSEVKRTLKEGGHLWLATDHQEYFQAMLEALAANDWLAEVEQEWVGARTNYEEKYLKQGKPINRLVLQKVQI